MRDFGGWSWLRRAQLPAGCEGLKEELERFREKLEDDCRGPEGELTASQVAVIDDVIQKLGFKKLTEKLAADKGLFVEDKDTGELTIRGALGTHYNSATNTIRQSLKQLEEGMKAKTGSADLASEWVKRKKAREEAKTTAKVIALPKPDEGKE